MVVLGVLLLVAVAGVGSQSAGWGIAHRRRVVGGGVGARAVSVEAERRAWYPQVFAIGVRRRSERTTRPFRGKRKLDNIGCFSTFFFISSAENISQGGELQ